MTKKLPPGYLKRTPRADWRPVAAHARRHPGMWCPIPEDWPTLNGWMVTNGDYPVFQPPTAYVVRGTKKGRQHVRFVGDPTALERELYELRMHPDDLTRTVQTREAGYEYGIMRCGFTLLPLDAERAVLHPDDLPAPVAGVDLAASDAVDEAHVIREAGRAHWAAVAETIKAGTGDWYRILGKWTSHASQIRKGSIAAFRPVGAWEARTRDYELEVRYVGEKTEATP